MEVVKSNTQKAEETVRFQENASAVLKQTLKKANIESSYIPTLVFAVFFGTAIYQVLSMYVSGQLTLGQVIAYISIYSNLKFPIANGEISFSFIGLGIASAGRIVKLLNTPADMENSKTLHTKDVADEIEFRDVSFGYDDKNMVLKNISFSAKPGETIAIVGSTGSGKSTLGKLVNRTYDVSEGQVLIDGIDVRN